jgi:hypothetical protein
MYVIFNDHLQPQRCVVEEGDEHHDHEQRSGGNTNRPALQRLLNDVRRDRGLLSPC